MYSYLSILIIYIYIYVWVRSGSLSPPPFKNTLILPAPLSLLNCELKFCELMC